MMQSLVTVFICDTVEETTRKAGYYLVGGIWMIELITRYELPPWLGDLSGFTATYFATILRVYTRW